MTHLKGPPKVDINFFLRSTRSQSGYKSLPNLSTQEGPASQLHELDYHKLIQLLIYCPLALYNMYKSPRVTVVGDNNLYCLYGCISIISVILKSKLLNDNHDYCNGFPMGISIKS